MSEAAELLAVPPRRRCELTLLNPCRYPDVRLRELRPWLAALLADVAPEASTFATKFTSDRDMRRINRTFRGRDESTDVLSFPGADETGAGGHLGDVVLSVPMARRQAAIAGHSLQRELRILLIHGVLHCQGHDHEVDGGEMERTERSLRRRWLEVSPR